MEILEALWLYSLCFQIPDKYIGILPAHMPPSKVEVVVLRFIFIFRYVVFFIKEEKSITVESVGENLACFPATHAVETKTLLTAAVSQVTATPSTRIS